MPPHLLLEPCMTLHPTLRIMFPSSQLESMYTSSSESCPPIPLSSPTRFTPGTNCLLWHYQTRIQMTSPLPLEQPCNTSVVVCCCSLSCATTLLPHPIHLFFSVSFFFPPVLNIGKSSLASQGSFIYNTAVSQCPKEQLDAMS